MKRSDGRVVQKMFVNVCKWCKRDFETDKALKGYCCDECQRLADQEFQRKRREGRKPVERGAWTDEEWMKRCRDAGVVPGVDVDGVVARAVGRTTAGVSKFRKRQGIPAACSPGSNRTSLARKHRWDSEEADYPKESNETKADVERLLAEADRKYAGVPLSVETHGPSSAMGWM